MSLTPIQYLIHYRLEVAAKYLCERSYNISDIELTCGFESHSYFSKQFKETYGLSPTAYRKQIIA
ncbi:helix-turn-helix transcriptional regulator [Fundicoccus sp. Sow4_D5]|uniref:helix-turn-helix transcriptional regulator n=1 Tax=unclassified Fundicoccus TaxID=2761543 RepID=UPI003F8D96F6